MSPPDNAVVLSVDEKPSIQALERAQGYLKLPNGRAMIGQSHDYKRNGTTTLFAALNVGTGEVTGPPLQTPATAGIPRLHEPHGEAISGQGDPCGSRQPVHTQAEAGFMAGAASECSFPLHPHTYVLAEPDRDMVLHPVGKITQRGSFGSVNDLIAHIDSFIANYNEEASPFVWTKSVVHQKRMKPCFTV